MSNYARPRISIVIDEDVLEAAKVFAKEEQRPLSTYISVLLSEVIREKVAQRKDVKKILSTSDRKT